MVIVLDVCQDCLPMHRLAISTHAHTLNIQMHGVCGLQLLSHVCVVIRVTGQHCVRQCVQVSANVCVSMVGVGCGPVEFACSVTGCCF